MTIWFTADTHFYHSNVIKYCNRPFCSIEEHNETLINNWNSRVQKQDHVYHLGDFGFGSPQKLYDLSTKLNGKIYLIKGNHDKNATKEPLCKRFEFIKDVHLLTVQHNNSKLQIFLSHYAHRVWPHLHHGAYMFYAHSHGHLPSQGRSLDVGVDCWYYTPIHLKEIITKIENLNPE